MKERILVSCIFAALFILFAVMACSVPAVISGQTQTVTNSSAFIGRSLAQMESMLFPHWWVLGSHASSGGSSFVVVFSPDGGVFTRTQANAPLNKTGSWQYNQATGLFSVADTAGARIGSNLEGVWDQAIYLGDEALVTGRQDYLASDIPRRIQFNNGVYFDGEKKENIGCLLIRFTGGVVNLGGGTFIGNAEYALAKTRATVSWGISPLGDQVLFSGKNSQDFHIYYGGKTRMISVRYQGPVYIDIDSPAREFFAQEGVEVVGKL